MNKEHDLRKLEINLHAFILKLGLANNSSIE